MGTPSSSSSHEPKQKIVMGYPSMDRYHPAAHNMHTSHGSSPSYTVPCPSQLPQAYPIPYATSSFNPNMAHVTPAYQGGCGYASTSTFQHPVNYLGPTSPNPYSTSVNGYYNQKKYKPLVVQETQDTSSFGRMMLIFLVVLVGSMCLMSLVMWFLFGTYIPEFQVMSLKVMNFTATNMSVTGDWKANILVRNLNEEFAIQFDHVRASVFYREVMMGISSAQAFEIEKKKQIQFNLTMDSDPTLNINTMQSWMMPTLMEDWSNGIVIFSLRLSVNANFSSSGGVLYRQESLRVMCENLKISFTPDGEGALIRGTETPCLIRLRGNAD